MSRIAVGGLHHETNTFAPQPATLRRFLDADGWPELLRGQALLTRPRGLNLAITGFIEAAEAAGHALAPLVWANCGPSGRVTEEAFETIVAWLLADLATALPVDGVFLDLHGAMVTEHLDDGEGELLRRVRALVGPDVPVVAALDLHANVSDAMVLHADALVAYRTYPHVDMAATGARCLPLLARRLAGRRLAKAHHRGRYLIPLPWQCSTIAPARALYAELARLEEGIGGAMSLVMGFPAADIECCGPAILAFGEDAAAVEAAGRQLAASFATAEPDFAGRFWEPALAVAEALRLGSVGRPAIIADTQDNPGGGGTGDSTGLLAALIAAGTGPAALGLLVDPEAAARAHAGGEGAVLEGLAMGGRHGPAGVAPVRGDFIVRRLGSGNFTASGPFYGGNHMSLGRMAALSPRAAPEVQVVLASKAVQAADREMFRHVGVGPERQRVLVLKSSVHFRADFEPLAVTVLVARAPGFVVADPAELEFSKLPAWLRRRPGQAACSAV